MASVITLVVIGVACSTPISVRRVPAREVHRSLTANVLTTGAPSAISTQVLHRLNLFDAYQRNPDSVLRRLRQAMFDDPDRVDILFALAELEFHRGEQLPRSAARPHFLASSLYAFRHVAILSRGDPAASFDPSWRLAADLYNRGLTSGLATDDGAYVDVTPRTVALPFGELTLWHDGDLQLWGGYQMENFVPAAELEVRGLRNRYRRAGIGAPLAASLKPVEIEDPPPGYDHISSLVRVPATAIVRFAGGFTAAEGDDVRGQIRVLTLDQAHSIEVGDRTIALEYEPTAALAFGLTETRPWEFELRGFLSGDFGERFDRGITMLAPYDADRIPVVFVHGTASSPWRWAEMINHLQSNPTIFENYQFWLFQFNTGNPIPFSGGLLGQALRDLVAELDPEGDDEKLRRMAVVGHSQGGLIAKLLVVDSGDVFWEGISAAPLDELDLEPDTRETIERSLFFEPLPFVKRVVFLATPHRGSFLAERWFARLAAGVVAWPAELVDAFGDLVVEDDDRLLLRSLDDMPSSVDNMTRDNRFLRKLVELPIAPGVEAHSIIAVSHDDDDPAVAHDGMVTVESQRLGNVTTEFIVESGHSTQVHPITIGEIARILTYGLEEPTAAPR
jgi:pimeloyl-ACP methyl ester carboxylesterase